MQLRVISLERIGKSYDGKMAVDGVDLEVPGGSVSGLMGPNGAGKTATMSGSASRPATSPSSAKSTNPTQNSEVVCPGAGATANLAESFTTGFPPV